MGGATQARGQKLMQSALRIIERHCDSTNAGELLRTEVVQDRQIIGANSAVGTLSLQGFNLDLSGVKQAHRMTHA
jgi:hypothetical protein